MGCLLSQQAALLKSHHYLPDLLHAHLHKSLLLVSSHAFEEFKALPIDTAFASPLNDLMDFVIALASAPLLLVVVLVFMIENRLKR